MSSWLQVRECELSALIESVPKIPEDHEEVVLKKPYGKGSYRLKYKELKRSKNTTLVLAYNRLVNINSSRGSYMQAIPVEPYQRRVPTYKIERQEAYFK